MKKIDNIIQETIDNFVNESILSEGTLDDIKGLLKAFKNKSNHKTRKYSGKCKYSKMFNRDNSHNSSWHDCSMN